MRCITTQSPRQPLSEQHLKEPQYATYPVAFRESTIPRALTSGLSKDHKSLALALTTPVLQQNLFNATASTPLRVPNTSLLWP